MFTTGYLNVFINMNHKTVTGPHLLYLCTLLWSVNTVAGI